MKNIVAALVLAFASPAFAERTHTVVPKDCLWDLAKHYYSNPFRWRVIHAANTNIVKDPHWIYPKQVLVIPDDTAAEVGELPARPVEAQPAPDPDAEVAAIAAPVEASAPAPKAAPQTPQAGQGDIGLSRGLSEGLAGGYPSMPRKQVEKNWKEDGKVIEFEGRETMAGAGDVVQAKLPAGGTAGDMYVVYRRVSALEHEDPKGTYIQHVGIVRLEEGVGKQAYRMTILKSADSVQLGDLLKKSGG